MTKKIKVKPEKVIETIKNLQKKLGKKTILFSEIKKVLEINDCEIIKVLVNWKKDIILTDGGPIEWDRAVLLNPSKHFLKYGKDK